MLNLIHYEDLERTFRTLQTRLTFKDVYDQHQTDQLEPNKDPHVFR